MRGKRLVSASLFNSVSGVQDHDATRIRIEAPNIHFDAGIGVGGNGTFVGVCTAARQALRQVRGKDPPDHFTERRSPTLLTVRTELVIAELEHEIGAVQITCKAGTAHLNVHEPSRTSLSWLRN